MSRTDGDENEDFLNQFWLQRHNMRQVVRSKRGRKALTDLRAALLALPEPRLIGRAMSTAGTVDLTNRASYTVAEYDQLLADEGVGVCAVGAYVWWQHVKAGDDPTQAMRDLPLNADYDGGSWETTELGVKAGLTQTLAWVLMSQNDDIYEDLTPEARYIAFREWIDKTLAESAVTA